MEHDRYPCSSPGFRKTIVYPTAISNASYFDGTAYVVRDTLNNERGWWIKFPSAQVIDTYEGAYIDSLALIANNGWNLIGSISSPIDTSMVYTDPPGSLASGYFKYSAGYSYTATIEPGGGYWVKTNAAGKFIMNLRSEVEAGRGSGPLSRLSNDDPPSFDTYDQFTVTDADGGRQHLYVRNAVLAGTSANLAMPPPMPDSSFDVRFSPGDILQSVEPDSEGIDLSIALNAVSYPAELSWEINPENELTYTLPEGGSLGKSIRGSNSMLLSGRGNGFIRINVSNRQSEKADVPTRFGLHQNYPNPFNPQTTISYDLPMDSRVTLKVFDVLGREVATLVDGVVKVGTHLATLNAARFASGIYFYRMQAGAFTSVRKLVVLK